MAKRVAVILSGCGNREGTEATEAVSCFIALAELGADVELFSPESVMDMSQRLARGAAKPLSLLDVNNFDALVLPGGAGVRRVLWELPVMRSLLEHFYESQKPIGAICIAPTLVAKVLGAHQPTLTLGRASEISVELEATGALFEECAVDDFVTDRANRIVTTPAYMYEDATPAQVYRGIRLALAELVEMA